MNHLISGAAPSTAVLGAMADWGDRIQTTLGFGLHLVLLPFVLAAPIAVVALLVLVPTLGSALFDWTA